LGYNDNTEDLGNSTIGDNEVLVQSFTLNDGTISDVGLPRFTYNTTAQGDFWGEISFQIFSPAGSLVADIGTGTAAGPIAIDYCAD